MSDDWKLMTVLPLPELKARPSPKGRVKPNSWRVRLQKDGRRSLRGSALQGESPVTRKPGLALLFRLRYELFETCDILRVNR